MSRKQHLLSLLKERILVLDGAMGTMIQQYQLNESDFRGEAFAHWTTDVKGNNDLLSITQPTIIKDIHKAYLQAGAQILETNTFNSQAVSLADYGMQNYASQINEAAVRCAKQAIEEFIEENPNLHKADYFIAGAIGPMNKTLSMSPDVNNPGFRAITFDEVSGAYYEQIDSLVKAGVDILLIETIFDTLNAKAAVYAIKEYFDKHQIELPVMVSGTITDASGRTLSGQTLEAFIISLSHAKPISFGFNCALGGKELGPHIHELAELVSTAVSAYPNAGLPNAMGAYDETPAITAAIIEEWASNGWVNIVGGCCGTTPKHIAAIAAAVADKKPRVY